MSILSATGSRNLPNVVIWLYFLASLPSIASVIEATEKIIESIINDTHSVLTVSSLIKDHIDIENNECYLSIPCVVGSNGIEQVLHPKYSQDEIESFKKCAKKMRESIEIFEN